MTPLFEHSSCTHTPLERDVLLELLSERLLADFPVEVWREVFVQSGHACVQFESGVVTFLSVDGLPEETRAKLDAAARRQGGQSESFGAPSTFVFREARHALKLALRLQAEAGHSLRIAVLTARCTTASFPIGGQERTLTLGCDAHLAAARASKTSAGSLYVAGETYPFVAHTLEQRKHGAIVAKQIYDGVVTSVLVTLPPARDAGVSTFAGLGLTHDAIA